MGKAEENRKMATFPKPLSLCGTMTRLWSRGRLGHQPTHPSREIRVREHRVVGRTSQAEPSSPTFDQIDGSLRSLGEEIGRRNRGPVGPNSVAKRVEGTLDWWHLRSIHRRRSVPRKKEPDTRLQWPFEPPFDN